MNRVRYNTDAIAQALALIPREIHPLIACDWVIGADPVFIGLHSQVTAVDGRAYKDTAHCVYGYHQHRRPKAGRHTTVVLTGAEPAMVVVHELGHVLHESLGFRFAPDPITWYAERNWCEAFAEAFSAWVGAEGSEPYAVYYRAAARLLDDETRDYFNQLCAA